MQYQAGDQVRIGDETATVEHYLSYPVLRSADGTEKAVLEGAIAGKLWGGVMPVQFFKQLLADLKVDAPVRESKYSVQFKDEFGTAGLSVTSWPTVNWIPHRWERCNGPLAWQPDVPGGTVRIDVELNDRPRQRLGVKVELNYGGTSLGAQQIETAEPRCSITSTIAGQNNGQAYESLLWSPENPRLIDAHVSLLDQDGHVVDEVWSYLGLRSAGESAGHFLLNDRPYYVRSILEQGYWPDSHLAAPDAAALREEVQLIKDLGFNTARLHEKVEDPRFLYWADRLGLLIWGEMGSTFEYSPTAVERVTREWTDVVRRDRSHPSIVTWVPLNESWGVQHIAHDPAQLHFAQSLYHLTKALDPSRPVISNDGWEHATSDLLTIHDYTASGEVLAARYGDKDEVRALLEGIGPAGRRMILPDGGNRGQPVMVSEFGGVSYAPDAQIDTWGYSTAASADEFAERLEELFGALRGSKALAGFCYTQLTDTVQEANGLTDEHRKPKLPIDTIRRIVTGEGS